MPQPPEENVGDLVDFKWGRRKCFGLKNKGVVFYESFVYEGVEYFLYDCVYFFHIHHVETSIGKLVKMYETPNHTKMVKVVWFLRPTELRNLLGNYQPSWNELFLASGVGKGVSNINLLESIIGKCSVVCTSKDKRNPQPSKAEINQADFFFNLTYDVGRHAIIDKFADEIDGIKVEQFFNKKRDEKTSNHLHVGKTVKPKIVIKTRTRTDDCFDGLHCPVKDEAEVRTSENVLQQTSLHAFLPKKRKNGEERSTISQSNKSFEEEEFGEKKAELRQDIRVKTYGKVIEVTERPNSEKRRWFKKMPWDEILKQAQKSETLVLLNNLDPSYTSHEVEDLVWHALKEKVSAKMIEWSLTSNTYYGKALVVFKTKDAAESAISELNRRCLILGEGRIVSAKKGILTEADKGSKFLGHLDVDRFLRLKQRQEMKKAKSTSHCSQQNTIEYGMSIEWILEYQKANERRNALYRKQMKEIEDTKSKLKMERIFFEA